MTLVRTAAALALVALAVLTGSATAGPAAPQVRVTKAASYSLTAGVWASPMPGNTGRVLALAFRDDGQCAMAVIDVNSKSVVGKSAGRYTLAGNQITLQLSTGTIRGTIKWFGPDRFQLTDSTGESMTFALVRD